MFLTEPDRTQFDLNWRMFGIPVRVHPLFWVFSAAFGWDLMNTERGGFPALLLWVGCVFVSILIHEMGHVLAGRLFGAEGHIVLYSFGGLAVGSSALANRWKRIAVYLAGPFGQLAFFGVIWLAYRSWVPRLNLPVETFLWVLRAYWFLKQINLFWGLLNLLPILPLDGGQISRDFFDWLLPDRGISVSLGISFLCAAVLAINAVAASRGRSLIPFLNYGDLYLALFFGLLALASFQGLQQQNARHRREFDDHEAWERDPNYWKR